MALKRRTIWLVLAILGLLGTGVFFWWFVQTAWLGSFPGRDVATYTTSAYIQLALAVASLAFSVVAFVKSAKASTRENEANA
jgi:hypothetical protein